MRYYYIFIILLLISTGCSSSRDFRDATYIILHNKAHQLCKEEGMEFSGSGGSMREEITMVSLKFNMDRHINVAEARRLCIHCIEELTIAINSSEEIAPHLQPYPFPYSAVRVSIMFLEKDGSFITNNQNSETISFVFSTNNFIFYDIYNPISKHLEDYYKETYEEALAIVNKEKSEQ